MTMGEAAGVAVDSEDAEKAFYTRVDQLYRMYEDWTGEVSEVDEAQAAPPLSERKQSNGAKCITAVEALSTFTMFAARLAVDFELGKDDFVAAVSAMYDRELESDEDEDEDEDEGDEGEGPPSSELS